MNQELNQTSTSSVQGSIGHQSNRVMRLILILLGSAIFSFGALQIPGVNSPESAKYNLFWPLIILSLCGLGLALVFIGVWNSISIETRKKILQKVSVSKKTLVYVVSLLFVGLLAWVAFF